MGFSGRCRCGACRYVLDAVALPRCYACHCLDCQTMTGSGFSLHAVVAVSGLVFEGPLETWSRVNGQGTQTTHYSCAVCRTGTHNTNVGRPGLAILRLGTLDASAEVVPVLHMWVCRKQRWIGLPSEAEIYEEAVPAARLRSLLQLPERDGE